MTESSLIASIQDDIGEINAIMMRVNRSAVFLDSNIIKVDTMRTNFMFVRACTEIALKHLDLLEAL